MIDNTGVNKLIQQENQALYYSREIATVSKAYQNMLDFMGETESKVRGAIIKLSGDPEFDKRSFDKQETIAVKKYPELEEDYLKLVEFRQKEKGLRRIIDGLSTGGSLTQSILKYFKETDYTPKTGYGPPRKDM